MAIVREPRILPKIREIVLMGGALREGGNTTPSAEFNIYVGPHAADIVFSCGRPIVVMLLDVTHQVVTTAARTAKIGKIGNKTGAAVQAMLEYYNRYDEEKYGTDGGPLHDPCTIAYLLEPRLFAGKDINLTIETQSALTMGATVADIWRVTERAANATWMHGVDADGFFKLLRDTLARLP